MSERTAQWWVKSQDPDAVAWRNAANFHAFQDVVVQALNDQKFAAGTISIPASEIERPPEIKGRYFTVPEAPVEAPKFISPQPEPANTGPFFTIPQEEA